MTYSVVGEKSKQEPVWKGPLDTVRVDTDLSFLGIFSVFMSVWLLVSIYAFVAGDVIEVHYSSVYHQYKSVSFSRYLFESLYNTRYFIVGIITLTVLLLAGYVAMFRWATRSLLVSITSVVSLVLVLDVYATLEVTLSGKFRPWLLLQATLFTAIYGLIMYALWKTGIDKVCKVIKESCKAMFFLPSTLLFGLCLFVVHLGIMLYAISVYEFLHSIKLPATGYELANVSLPEGLNDASEELREKLREEAPVLGYTPSYVYVLQLVNLLCYLWASWFVEGLARGVLTAAFATWYHAEGDSELLPNGVLLKCFVAIASHHVGTAAYASSPFALYVLADVVCKYGREGLSKIYKQPVLLLSWLTILLNFSFDALTLNAIHGSNFYDSAKNSYVLLMKNPLSYLAVNAVSECIIFIGLLLVPVISLGSVTYVALYWLEGSDAKLEFLYAWLLVAGLLLVMTLTCFIVFRAAFNTIRCCYLEDSKFKHEAEMKLYEVHVDDISIVEANCR